MAFLYKGGALIQGDLIGKMSGNVLTGNYMQDGALIKVVVTAGSTKQLKGIFGYCPRVSFLRRETGKVVWVLSFDHFQIRIQVSDTFLSGGFFRIFWTKK